MLPTPVASLHPFPASLLLLLSWSGAAAAERVDRVESVLGERVVTTSDIALEHVLAARDPSPVPALVAADRAGLEDQRRVRGHAGQVRLYQPSTRALEARLAALRRTFEAPGAWEDFLATWGLSDAALRAMVLNRMVVETTVLRTLGTPVPGEEDAWRQRYDAWMDELRAGQEPHHPEPLP